MHTLLKLILNLLMLSGRLIAFRWEIDAATSEGAGQSFTFW